MDWADGFMVVYNISDRASFINAENLVRQIREARLEHCKGSAAASSSILPSLPSFVSAWSSTVRRFLGRHLQCEDRFLPSPEGS